MSSQSERFSDDQAYSNHSSQSPEVTSKDEPHHEEFNDGVKTLSEKLSAALLNISAKEDLVKQHAKVAEEAVSGWEKAENEVLALKKQVEVLILRNSTLEDRVGHLDGALKECLRQLRQAREEKEQKVQEVIDKKTSEWQITKSDFENQLSELRSQLQYAKTENSASIAAEKENSALKLELSSIAEELEFRVIERDLSNQAAEQASKQHLESIKKVAKLEAEIRKLKALVRKTDHRSVTASSVYVESFTDSQSDIGERLLTVENDNNDRSDSWASALVAEMDKVKNGKGFERNLMAPSIEINLMDDFLEMERLAALPESEPIEKMKQTHDGEIYLKAELEAVMSRRSELEEMLEKMEMEKEKLEITVNELENQLNTSRNQLEELKYQLASTNNAREVAEKELESSSTTLKTLKDRLERKEKNLMELQSQLDVENEARRAAEKELEVTYAKKEEAQSRYIVLEDELKALLAKVESLEGERALSREMVAKCRKLEDEVSRLRYEIEGSKAASWNGELRIKEDLELAVAQTKFAECQTTIASLSRQLKSLATLDDFLLDTEISSKVSKGGAESWKLHPKVASSSESWMTSVYQ